MLTTVARQLNLTLLLMVGACGCAGKTDPADGERAAFTDGMNAYLQKRGVVCLDYATWPVDVTEHDVAVGAREARQLPVLQSLGLVSSLSLPLAVTVTDGHGTGLNVSQATRYQLTGAGRAFFVDRQTRQALPPDSAGRNGQTDLCALTLSLNAIVSWHLFKAEGGEPARATVTYTYNVGLPAWARDDHFAQVFPAIARVVRGAGRAQLVEGFTLTAAGWTANELLAPSPAPVQVVRR